MCELVRKTINQPDMREKVKEYISELEAEIKRVHNKIINADVNGYEALMMVRLDTLTEVRYDLLGRLEEVV